MVFLFVNDQLIVQLDAIAAGLVALVPMVSPHISIRCEYGNRLEKNRPSPGQFRALWATMPLEKLALGFPAPFAIFPGTRS